MTTHVAIVKRPLLLRILDGSKTIESRLTITPKPPFKQIKQGDRIYFKASGGKYMAVATAGKIEFHENLTPPQVDALKKQYNAAVFGDDEYWQLKRTARFATFVHLEDVVPTSIDLALPPSRGDAWFVCDDSVADPVMIVKLTDGALRNRYVPAPDQLRESDRSFTLHLPDGQKIETDVTKRSMIRWRGWKSLFEQAEVAKGDRVIFEQVRPGHLNVRFDRAKPKPPTPNRKRVNTLIRLAVEEDLGPKKTDITSACLLKRTRKATAVMRSRASGVLAGVILLDPIAASYDKAIRVDKMMDDGDRLRPGSVVAEFSGPLVSILAMERVALNFLTRLCGIATITARYVDEVVGMGAAIYDTRKTIPGYRDLEKYAVVCGGGACHRMGLHDAVLVKDNHIAHLDTSKLTRSLTTAIKKARAGSPKPKFIEVEVDTLAQMKRVLACPVDIILLDNMNPTQLKEAVALRDRVAPSVKLEASGGVTLKNAKSVARTGVERIAIGAITHSAPSLDLGLDIDV